MSLLSLSTDVLLALSRVMSSDDLSWVGAWARTCRHLRDFVARRQFWVDRLTLLGLHAEQVRHALGEEAFASETKLRAYVVDCYVFHMRPRPVACVTFDHVCAIDPAPIALHCEGNTINSVTLKGRLAATVWVECDGSTSTGYQYLQSMSGQAAEEVAEAFLHSRALLNKGLLSPNVELPKQLRSVLSVFATGRYKARVQHRVVFADVFGCNVGEEKRGRKSHFFYPHGPLDIYYGEHLFCLERFLPHPLRDDPREFDMSEERVQHYEKEIRGGRRPLLLVLCGRYSPTTLASFTSDHAPLLYSYLVDGRHKLVAYMRCDVLPSVLRLQCLESGISLAEHKRLLGQLEQGDAEQGEYSALYVVTEFVERGCVPVECPEDDGDSFEMSAEEEAQIRAFMIAGERNSRIFFRKAQ
jgi:hypothetical protein